MHEEDAWPADKSCSSSGNVPSSSREPQGQIPIAKVVVLCDPSPLAVADWPRRAHLTLAGPVIGSSHASWNLALKDYRLYPEQKGLHRWFNSFLQTSSLDTYPGLCILRIAFLGDPFRGAFFTISVSDVFSLWTSSDLFSFFSFSFCSFFNINLFILIGG